MAPNDKLRGAAAFLPRPSLAPCWALLSLLLIGAFYLPFKNQYVFPGCPDFRGRTMVINFKK
jgi:hypothetical protein